MQCRDEHARHLQAAEVRMCPGDLRLRLLHRDDRPAALHPDRVDRCTLVALSKIASGVPYRDRRRADLFAESFLRVGFELAELSAKLAQSRDLDLLGRYEVARVMPAPSAFLNV